MVDPPSPPPEQRSFEQSMQLLHDAIALIPNATNTASKGPTNWVRGAAPSHMERANGCRCWDVDGNEYIDYPMGRGPVVLGHDYPPVTEAVVEQLRNGVAFSTPHRLQIDVAEAVTDLVPCAELVRFAKNGNDVTALAAKLARAHTGRSVIATHGYHGWPDVWLADSATDAGIPPGHDAHTESFGYNDLDRLEQIFEEHPDEVAAIVMTPADTTPPEDGFLDRVKALAREEGALLVFDEIITGFRFAPGGAQEYFDVVPDLACFAKGIANGMPLSCLAGRADVMRTIEDDDFVFSLTYGGEAAALAAANASLEIHDTEPVTEHLFARGETLIEEYNRLSTEHGLAELTNCSGFGPRSSVSFTGTDQVSGRLIESLFQQECIARGVLYAGVQFTSYSHTAADIEYTLDVYDEALATVAAAIEAGDVRERLAGHPIGASLPHRIG